MDRYKKIFIADIYESINSNDYLVMKDAIIYKTEFENIYRIINISEYDMEICDKIVMHPNNSKTDNSYYIKEMKDFIYMNGIEIEKVMKYVK